MITRKLNRKFRSMALKLRKFSDQGHQKIAFLHIGKNAGTQILHLAKQINSIKAGVEINGLGHGYMFHHLSEDRVYFFSIRNPADRFKSAFYSRKRKGQPKFYNEWSPEEETAFRKFEHANDLAEALFRSDELGRLAFHAMDSIGHVKKHQVDWFKHAGFFLDYKPPIHIIRQENFEQDFDTLLRKLGLTIGLQDLQISTERKVAHSFDYSKVPELSQVAKHNLELWYARDIEFYRVCERWILDHEAPL